MEERIRLYEWGSFIPIYYAADGWSYPQRGAQTWLHLMTFSLLVIEIISLPTVTKAITEMIF
jgi:hypothetical protein